MPKGGLSRWFSEKWVDLSRPKKDGGFEPCGRPDADEGKYPKCVPANKAKNMTPEEIRSAIQRKRRAESTTQREDKKPIMVPTISKESKSIPANPELYAKVKAEAKAKFDVYPSAYANGWLVQEYKRRGGKYKTITKGDFPGHPFRGNQHTGGKTSARNVRGKTSGGGSGKKAEAQAKFEKLVDERTEAVVKKLVAVTGDKDIAEFWKPKIREAIRVWQNPNAESGDMDKPLVVDGIKFARQDDPTKLITATNILDMVSNTIGTEALTGISDAGLADSFRNLVKGDYPGHPFRGNQWTGGIRGGRASLVPRIASGEKMTGAGAPASLKAMALEGGFTYNPKRNEIRSKGFAVAVKKEYEKRIPEKEFAERGEEIIKQYVKTYAEQLAQPTAHLGAWKEKGEVFLDVSVVKPDVVTAANIGRANDQIGIFDLATFTTHYRHRSPTTGEWKYIPQVQMPGYASLAIDAIGKAMKGVMLIPAESIDDSTIPNIVERIMDLKPIGGKIAKAKRIDMEMWNAGQGGLINPTLGNVNAVAEGVERVDYDTFVKERRKVLKNYRGLKKTAYQQARFIKENEAGGRWGGELGRGNNQVRARRRQRMLESWGSGSAVPCIYCGAKLNSETMELEKLVPEIGYDTFENLAPACRKCNGSMNKRTFKDKIGMISKDSPTVSDVHTETIMNPKKKRDLKKKKMAMEAVVQKKEALKDPKGGLTAAGRKHFKQKEGSNLKPGVRGAADTPEKMRRKGSFLTRFFTNPSGPMVNDKGEPTRLALSAQAWGEPVPKNRSDAARLAEKGRRLLERYENTKK